MYSCKPDYEMARKRMDAWWDCEIVDRALVSISFPKPLGEQVPLPKKEHASLRERWLDVEFQAEGAAARTKNTVYAADSLPIQCPNLGPEIFSAFYGCEIEFGEDTSWSKPLLHDWEPASVERVKLDTNNFYYRKMLELMDAYLAIGKGEFITGQMDFHPGADALAGFRDPQNLCMDILEEPEAVRAMVDRVTADFFPVYDFFNDRIAAAGDPCANWMGIACDGRGHIPSNDFSCMISDRDFESIFLPGIEQECAYMDRNVYHLDGPQALRFLDRILEIPKLHALQWVPGAGQEDWRNWVEVYRRIQAAGKGFPVYLQADSLDELTKTLRPEGAWLLVGGITDQAGADAALRKIEKWT